jgi:hypothetical protein
MATITQNRQENVRFSCRFWVIVSIFGRASGHRLCRCTVISVQRTRHKLGRSLPDVLQDLLLFVARLLPTARWV